MQKSVDQHSCDLKQLESKVCGLQRRLTESTNRIDALEAASCTGSGKSNSPRKSVAELCHDRIIARIDNLAVSVSSLEGRFEIFRSEMANDFAASASKFDSLKHKLVGDAAGVPTDDLQVCLANASNHVKRLEKLSERWKAHQNKDLTAERMRESLGSPQEAIQKRDVSTPRSVNGSFTNIIYQQEAIQRRDVSTPRSINGSFINIFQQAHQRKDVFTDGTGSTGSVGQAHQRRDIILTERTSGSVMSVDQQELIARTTMNPSNGSLHLDEAVVVRHEGIGHRHNLRVARPSALMASTCPASGAATVPAPPPMPFSPMHSVPPLRSLERVQLDDWRVALMAKNQETREPHPQKKLTSENTFAEGASSSSGTSGNTNASATEESSGSSGNVTVCQASASCCMGTPWPEPCVGRPRSQEQAVSVHALLSPRHGEHRLSVAQTQPLQHSNGCLSSTRGRSVVSTGPSTGVQVWTPKMRTFSSLTEARRHRSAQRTSSQIETGT